MKLRNYHSPNISDADRMPRVAATCAGAILIAAIAACQPIAENADVKRPVAPTVLEDPGNLDASRGGGAGAMIAGGAIAGGLMALSCGPFAVACAVTGIAMGAMQGAAQGEQARVANELAFQGALADAEDAVELNRYVRSICAAASHDDPRAFRALAILSESRFRASGDLDRRWLVSAYAWRNLQRRLDQGIAYDEVAALADAMNEHERAAAVTLANGWRPNQARCLGEAPAAIADLDRIGYGIAAA